MKILLINGSPKGKRSNSLKLAYSFIEGFKNGCTDDEESISIDELHVASMNIAACKGCFACWQKTPGICCIKDDMQKVIEKLIDADLILWSFPLYYFNVPGILKNLIDRQLSRSHYSVCLPPPLIRRKNSNRVEYNVHFSSYVGTFSIFPFIFRQKGKSHRPSDQ